MHAVTKKVALIVGASSGIGLAVARILAAQGIRLFIVARGGERLDKATKETGATSIVGDFSDPAISNKIIQSIEQESGVLDYLVHSAAYEVAGGISDLTEEELEQAVSTNVMGNMSMLRKAIPLLRKSKAASVVVIGSVGSERAYKNYAEHYLCKSALLGMVRSASMDLGRYNIRVNMVSPGWVMTEGGMGFIAHLCGEKEMNEEQVKALLCSHVPLERMSEPAEVANTVDFLLSDKASYITGVNIPVDGGLMNVDAGMTGLLGT